MNYHGVDVRSAVRKSLGLPTETEQCNPGFESKRTAGVLATPIVWSGWIEVFAQLGVVGRDKRNHVTYVDVTFSIEGEYQSSYDIEIKGGDRFIRTYGVGSTKVRVAITGNVATAISVRVRSHTTPIQLRITT